MSIEQKMSNEEYLLFRRNVILRNETLAKTIASVIENGNHNEEQFIYDGIVLKYRDKDIKLCSVRYGCTVEYLYLSDFEKHAIMQSIEVWLKENN